LLAPASAQINEAFKKVTREIGRTDLSAEDIGAGLKEALLKGVKNGSDKAAAVDGFFRNPAIKIPFPRDAKKAADALKNIGMEKEIKNFVKTLNRSAEMAAGEAKPIFVDAIKEMSIEDAWGILNGNDNQGATNYLKESTSDKLFEKMSPIVSRALESTDATKYYRDLIKRYNKIPFVKKKNADLSEYATQKTLDGLFYLVGEEEEKIRENPAARTSDILRRVFNTQD